MQVPTADAGAKDVYEKCEKCETLEKSLKKAELKVQNQKGELHAKTRENGKLQEANDELKGKAVREVCGVCCVCGVRVRELLELLHKCGGIVFADTCGDI